MDIALQYDARVDRQNRSASPVCAHNEWDPLEEVVVGRLEGATVPTDHAVIRCNIPGNAARVFGMFSGVTYPQWFARKAQRELDNFIHLLQSHGVAVRRPEPFPHGKKFATPYWSARGFCNACPRDSLLVVGEEIIEAPMAWPTRYFESHAYRELLKEYWRKGAQWTAAPKPQLLDQLFDSDYTVPGEDEPVRFILTEFEPVFDAADFVRCGRDLFVTRSNVTNLAGIEWLRRHLGSEYRIHLVESRSRQPMHIDTTFMPVAPGKLIVNPEYVDPDRLPEVCRSWDVLIAPEPDTFNDRMLKILSMCGRWLSMNVLMLDERRVIVEEHHTSTIRALERWGFEPIPCPFLHYAPFGGGFHCATLDVRRRGTLQSYF
jgi:glycine amidinotransferase